MTDNLIALAEQMTADLLATGLSQTRTITHSSLTEPANLTLRYNPNRTQMQVVVATEAVQLLSSDLQQQIKLVFGIPQYKSPTFGKKDGYGINKWTWGIERAPEPVQETLFELPAAVDYYRE